MHRTAGGRRFVRRRSPRRPAARREKRLRFSAKRCDPRLRLQRAGGMIAMVREQPDQTAGAIDEPGADCIDQII
jgi:hypothetical protein